MDEREKNLPRWAQELIRQLRLQVQTVAENSGKELAILRPRVEKLRAENDGLQELLRCAAKGGHITAIEVVNCLAGYGLVLAKDE